MRRVPLPTVLAGVLVLAVAGCSVTTASTTHAEPTRIAALGSTSTVGPTTSGPLPRSLFVLGDSFVAWADWPEMLAHDLEELWSTPVLLDDGLAAPGPLAHYEPELLDTDASARTALATAHLVVLEPRPSFIAATAMERFVAGECGGSDNRDCIERGLDEMQVYVDDYLDLVVDLADAESTIVVILVGSWPVDAAYPDLRTSDAAVHEVLATFAFDLMRIVEDAAWEREMPTVDVGAVFNGPEYLDPMNPEYLVADGLHLSESGSRVVTDEVLAVLQLAE